MPGFEGFVFAVIVCVFQYILHTYPQSILGAKLLSQFAGSLFRLLTVSSTLQKLISFMQFSVSIHAFSALWESY